MAHKHYEAVIGRVVQSSAGRDAGKLFMVVAVLDKDYVLIADGRTHKLAKPKKKKYKHVVPLPEVLESIASKINSNAKVFDSEVGSALRQVCQNKEDEVEVVNV